ncbi:MAG: nicotinate-nucleotide adenylyltransferase [bacterium JZ-2024 1]
MKIGLMGGTFNPIHYGHLLVAEEAREEFHLEEIWFIPSGCPPHKRHDELASAQDRLYMCQLAIEGIPYFRVISIEIESGVTSYTYNTLRVLNQQNPGNEWFFITGLDAILELPTWHHAEELLDMAHFVAVSRPGHKIEELSRVFSEEQRKKILTLNIPYLDISSSEIRRRVRFRRSIRFLTPEPVRQFILSKGLYKGDKS